MKLLKLTSVYPNYAEELYGSNPGLAAKTYDQQNDAVFYDAFAWADSWKVALAPMGIEVMEVIANIEPLQRAWARENLPGSLVNADLKTLAVQQVLKFGPDVLWFDDQDVGLLQHIRETVPSIRLVLGWTGSAIPSQNAFDQCDVILSCSRESVEYLEKLGHRAAELHHGFDARILSRVKPGVASNDIIFIGHLVRSSDFHIAREKLLEEMVTALPVKIYSPLSRLTPTARAKRIVKQGISSAYRLLNTVGMGATAAGVLRAAGKNEEWHKSPSISPNPKLTPHMNDGVYGLHMYQTILDSKVTLNIHADSSDRYASNMRLFEVTGVGGCLLTDWKSNLSNVFRLDEEVVAYRSAAECIEKARWLLDKPEARAAIARAGQARTLHEHTYLHRAHHLDEIIRAALGE